MNSFFRHRATLDEVEAICNMGNDEALKISRDLALTHIALIAYYQVSNVDDIARLAARELGIKIVPEEVERPQEYILAPYVIEGEIVIRGVALWQSLADYNRYRD